MEIRKLAKEAVLINEDATFREAVEIMVRRQTNSLLVVNEEAPPAIRGTTTQTVGLDVVVAFTRQINLDHTGDNDVPDFGRGRDLGYQRLGTTNIQTDLIFMRVD